jgi:beta-lactamase regulating signal transducer with metallopeptidase domain
MIEAVLSNPQLAKWLINFTFQSMVVLLLGYIISRLLMKKAAPFRSGISLVIIVMLLCLPFFSVLFHTLNLPAYQSFLPFDEEFLLTGLNSSEMARENGKGQQIELVNSPGSLISQDNSTAKDTSRFWIFPKGVTLVKLINGFGIIWLVGGIFFLSRFAYAIKSMMRFKKGLTEIPSITHRLRELNESMAYLFPGLTMPRVFTSPNLDSPLVIGVFHSFLVIPDYLYDSLSQGELKSIVFHEMSHIYHKDQIVSILQRMVIAFHWWNPLVYGISTTFSRAREEVSDNYALLENNSRKYAECLINLAERSALISKIPLSLGMAAPHLPLKERIKYILSKERKMDTKLKKTSIFMIIFVAVMITGFVIGHDWTFALEKEKAVAPAAISKLTPLQQRFSSLQELAEQQQMPAKMINALNQALFNRVKLLNVQIKDGIMMFSAQTYSRSYIDDLKKLLYKSTVFDKINLLSATNGNPIIFNIEASYKKEDKAINKPTINDLEKKLTDHMGTSLILRKVIGLLLKEKVRIIRTATLAEVKGIHYESVPMKVEAIGKLKQFNKFFNVISEMETFITIQECKISRNKELKYKGLLNIEFTYSMYVKKVNK